MGKPGNRLFTEFLESQHRMVWSRHSERYIGNEYITPVQKAFDGMIREFTRLEEDGTYTLTHCCAVAGLGGNSGKYRDGSFEYYIGEPVIENDPKSVGAFILAAIEYERMN